MNENGDIREPTEVCDVISSLAIDGTPETTGVTTFVQEACTSVSAVSVEHSVTPYPVQDSLQDVRQYFSRPVAISTGTVPTGVRGIITGAFVSWDNILAYWVTGNARLLGAYGIRATLVFTLQIAATPFHQGLVVLSWQYGDSAFTAYNRTRDACTATNLPHVVLDVSSDSMVQLKVPFLFPAEYALVNGNTLAHGAWAISSIAQTPSVTGMNAPTYQVFAHLEDISLFGATPQATTNIVLNAGKRLSPVTEEFEKDSHPFSSALHAAGRAIGFIAKGVPQLSTVGGIASWALGHAAGVARYFGFGKPAVTDPLMRVFRSDAVGEWNTDVATASMVVACTANNTTIISPTVGASDVDEMSFKYITSRWAQCCNFSITTSTAASTLVYGSLVSPLALYFRAPASLPAFNKFPSAFSTATTNSIQPTHLFFAASSFKQWRGGIKWRFTFCKTKMHAGRVMVVFNPTYATPSLTTDLTTSTTAPFAVYGTSGPDPFAYSAIFDLKDGNVFEFPVPYISAIPYANTSAYVGTIAMYVVNPLVAPSVVSNTVSVVVEVAGMPDFELANPVGIMFNVHNQGTINVQSGKIVGQAPEVLDQNTMGEVITSVKQLISMPHVSNVEIVGGDIYVVPPWYYQPTPSAVVPAVGTPLALGMSYGGNWASCYTFLKGGTDIHVYNPLDNGTFSVIQLPGAGGYRPFTKTADNRGTSNAPSYTTTQNSLHARLPGFFPTSRVFSYVANILTSAGGTWGTGPSFSGANISPFFGIQALYGVLLQNSDSTIEPVDSVVYFNRNAADDAQLAMYIGPPPVFLPASPAASGNYDPDGYF